MLHQNDCSGFMSVNGAKKEEQLMKSTLKLNARKTLSSNEQLSYSLCNILACSMVLFNEARDFEITIVRYVFLAFHIDFLFIALQKRDKKDTHIHSLLALEDFLRT